MAKSATDQVVQSSGNVFADLGLPDAAELDTKAQLCAALNRIVKRQRLTQVEVTVALGINQPKVSALLHYKLEGFSVERLMHFLVALGQDVEIHVKDKLHFKTEGLSPERLVRFLDANGQDMEFLVKAKPGSRSARIAVKAA
jgi:predicted XRE-type DNA-binding protein